MAYDTGTAIAASNLAVALKFTDGTSATLPTANTTSAGWNTQTIGLAAYAGKTVSDVSLVFDGSNAALSSYAINVGQIVVTNGTAPAPQPGTARAQVGGGATDATTNGTVRLQWAAAAGASTYNVYQKLTGGSETSVGGTANRSRLRTSPAPGPAPPDRPRPGRRARPSVSRRRCRSI